LDGIVVEPGEVSGHRPARSVEKRAAACSTTQREALPLPAEGARVMI
jgi:hypothetical protein